MAIPAGLPTREVQFRVRREDWSKYAVLDDRAVVWARAVMVKLHEINVAALAAPPGGTLMPGPHFIPFTQTVVTAFFPEDMRGESDLRPTRPEDFATGGEVLRRSLLEEPDNEYVTAGTPAYLVTTRCIATRIRIFRDRFIATGDPLMAVDTQVVVGVPRELGPGELTT